MKYTYNAIVKSVYDGDTIRVDIDLGFGVWLFDQSIRLFDINSPEIRGETKSLGQISKNRLSALILDRKIKLETIKDKKEKYGRWLGIIFLEIEDKEICINDLMISEGLAVKYL